MEIWIVGTIGVLIVFIFYRSKLLSEWALFRQDWKSWLKKMGAAESRPRCPGLGF